MISCDCLVIGGGPAGMSAGLEAAKNGSNTIIIERNGTLGGILNQCIHNGFGLHYFGEELTGPEFANKLIQKIKRQPNLSVMLNTFVTKIEPNKVTITNTNGVQTIKCKSLVLAMGAREKTAANILLTGTRPAGVYTAGTAQKLVNMQGKMIGKNVVILGSGDIGLIMARRLTLEGAKVHAIFEINSHSSGLRRNIMQCVEDFNIPLLYNTTICEVVGESRVEGVWYAKVDQNWKPIESTKKFIKCDCLILSVGLAPEMDLIETLPLSKNGGALVDEYFMTAVPGVFSCGNVLHIHDLVDNVATESASAGKFASLYAQNKLQTTSPINVKAGAGVSYVVPSVAYNANGEFVAKFRLKEKTVKQWIVAKSGENVLAKMYVMAGVPGEMLSLKINKQNLTSDIVLEVQ